MPPAPPCKIGILVSGRGSNMLAIVRAVERRRIKGAKVAVVISDVEDAGALAIATRHGIPAIWVDPALSTSRPEHDRRMMGVLEEHGVSPGSGLVLLAGYMRLLSTEFVEAFRGRMLNIHPALLPAFPGLHAQRKALDWGVKVAGCTVHFVVPDVDSGPIVLQACVKVEPGDTEESLSARILRQEHRIYPIGVKLFVEGRLKIEGRRVVILT